MNKSLITLAILSLGLISSNAHAGSGCGGVMAALAGGGVAAPDRSGVTTVEVDGIGRGGIGGSIAGNSVGSSSSGGSSSAGYAAAEQNLLDNLDAAFDAGPDAYQAYLNGMNASLQNFANQMGVNVNISDLIYGGSSSTVDTAGFNDPADFVGSNGSSIVNNSGSASGGLDFNSADQASYVPGIGTMGAILIDSAAGNSFSGSSSTSRTSTPSQPVTLDASRAGQLAETYADIELEVEQMGNNFYEIREPTRGAFFQYEIRPASDGLPERIYVQMMEGDPELPGFGNHLMNQALARHPGTPVYGSLAFENGARFKLAMLELANSGEITEQALREALQNVPALRSVPGTVQIIPQFDSRGDLIDVSVLRTPDPSVNTATITNIGDLLNDSRFMNWMGGLPERVIANPHYTYPWREFSEHADLDTINASGSSVADNFTGQGQTEVSADETRRLLDGVDANDFVRFGANVFLRTLEGGLILLDAYVVADYLADTSDQNLENAEALMAQDNPESWGVGANYAVLSAVGSELGTVTNNPTVQAVVEPVIEFIDETVDAALDLGAAAMGMERTDGGLTPAASNNHNTYGTNDREAEERASQRHPASTTSAPAPAPVPPTPAIDASVNNLMQNIDIGNIQIGELNMSFGI